jgi:hypothetical protein
MMTNAIARGGFTARYNDSPIRNLITFGSQHKGFVRRFLTISTCLKLIS